MVPFSQFDFQFSRRELEPATSRMKKEVKLIYYYQKKVASKQDTLARTSQDAKLRRPFIAGANPKKSLGVNLTKSFNMTLELNSPQTDFTP